MKKITILGLGLLSAVALSSAAFLAMPGTVKEANASAAGSISDSAYEVAFLEQYMVDSANPESYQYTSDKPLSEKNALPGHLYGNKESKKIKFSMNLQNGVNDTFTWKFSGVRVKGIASPYRIYAQLENNSSDMNICKAESFPAADFPDEAAIGALITADGMAKGAAMISSTEFDVVNDISFFWRSSYTKRMYICYKIDGESEWKIYRKLNQNAAGEGLVEGNYTGTNGWDAHGFTTFNSTTWTEHELYGAKAKIAFACCEAPTESGSVPLSAILINANNAAVKYLNALSYREGVCTEDTQFDLDLGQEDHRHNQDLFKLATERADADFLAEYDVGGTKTLETNILGFYNYLVGSIPGLGSVKSASARFGSTFTSANSNTIVTVVVLASVSAVAVTSFFVFKKKKHN